MAVHKPAGMLIHRSRIDRAASRFLLQTVRDQIGQRVYPVHRLDKPTAGIVLMALMPAIARSLSEQFASALVEKQYLAICRGYSEAQQRIDYPLVEPFDPTTDQLADRDKPAQAAHTDLQRLATVELPQAVGRYPTARYSLLLLQPRTGRRHQLRRHLKHIFHPIIGDTTYGDGRHNQFFRRHFGNHQLMLCAWRLRLRHPGKGDELILQTHPETSFSDVLARAPWKLDPAAACPSLIRTYFNSESN